MPVMAAHERNDARGAARLLAVIARECVNDPKMAPEKKIVLNNVFRMLEAYRKNAFFGTEAPSLPYAEDAASTLTLMPSVQRHVSDVRMALDEARGVAFAGEPKDVALDQVEDVLKKIIHPDQPQAMDTLRAKAMSFFAEMARRLELA